MKQNTFYIVSLFLISAVPVVLPAQVSPGKIDQKLLRESLEAVLGTADSLTWKEVPINDAVKKSLKGKLKAKNSMPDTLYIGTIKTEEGLRSVIPDIAPSKSERFSYLLYLDENDEIIDVDVLKYRENYGYEIDYPYFRKQFKGKAKGDDIRFRRSIQNISGATISARSITYSVHDLMALINEVELE